MFDHSKWYLKEKWLRNKEIDTIMNLVFRVDFVHYT